MSKKQVCIKENPEEIRLDDCLACSGCLSNDEMSKFNIDKTVLEDILTQTNFIFTEFSKNDLFLTCKKIHKNLEEITFRDFEKALITLIKSTFNTLLFLDSSNFEKSKNNINSDCPAVVLYVERLYPHLTKYLNNKKTQIQQAVEYIRKKNKERIFIISQCYDKKDEIIREKYENIYLLGAKDIENIIIKDINNFLNNQEKLLETNKYELSHFDKKENIIFGQVNVFNALQNYKEGSGFLNVYWCNNGCIGGPCIENKEKDIPFEHNDYIKGKNSDFLTCRKPFTPHKKKRFEIEW